MCQEAQFQPYYDARDDSRERKKERTDLDASRRALLVDEEARQIRPREMVVGASSYIPMTGERSNTYGA